MPFSKKKRGKPTQLGKGLGHLRQKKIKEKNKEGIAGQVGAETLKLRGGIINNKTTNQKPTVDTTGFGGNCK